MRPFGHQKEEKKKGKNTQRIKEKETVRIKTERCLNMKEVCFRNSGTMAALWALDMRSNPRVFPSSPLVPAQRSGTSQTAEDPQDRDRASLSGSYPAAADARLPMSLHSAGETPRAAGQLHKATKVPPNQTSSITGAGTPGPPPFYSSCSCDVKNAGHTCSFENSNSVWKKHRVPLMPG